MLPNQVAGSIYRNNPSVDRIVQQEILDTLSPTDPAAIANRRDLRLYNCLMGNFRWFCNEVRRLPGACNILELGAGDGSLGMYLHRQAKSTAITGYTGLDLIPVPPNWPAGWHWIDQDLRTHDFATANQDVLLGNLILHQFDDETLRSLGKRLLNSRLRLILLNEPSRKRFHMWQVALTRLLGVHPVTLHDANVSIRAGFRRNELAETLGIRENAWEITFSDTFMGANRLICKRRQ